MSKSDLYPFFHAQTIAVVGASNNPGKVGYDVVNNLKLSNYPGKIFPVNPKDKVIQGLKAYKSMAEIKETIELVTISVPAKFVLQIIDQMNTLKIHNVIIITAGFKEIGPDGAQLENELGKKLQEYNIKAIGPNCLGLLDTSLPLNASFASRMPHVGNLGFISQSGALITGILDWAENEGLGFSSFISVGNKVNVDEVDLIEELGRDDKTKAILAYLEAIDHGPRFIEVCQEVMKKKPIVVLKSGKSKAGARAASSHTGSMTGTNTAYNVAFEKAGVLRAATIEELFDTATAFSQQPLPPNPNVAIITNAGGPGIIATDEVEESGLQLASLSRESMIALQEQLPPAASVHNPIDILGTGNAAEYRLASEMALQDDNVGAIIIIMTPQGMTEPMGTAEALIELNAKYPKKPILAAYMGGADLKDATMYLKEHNIPCFSFPERAISALAGLWKYSQMRSKMVDALLPRELDNIDKQQVADIFESVRNKGRVALLGSEAIAVARAYGIASPETYTAFSVNEAKKYAATIGYPIVMKITSPEITHKSDIGGVVIGVKNDDDLEKHYRSIMRSARDHYPNAKVMGIDIQAMGKVGTEMIIGVSKDPQFGHLAIIGAGGIFTNILQDVSFGLIPINHATAKEMLENTKIYQILSGARDTEKADIEKIIDALERISQLVNDFPSILDLDINPFFADASGINAVDVKITISKEAEVNY